MADHDEKKVFIDEDWKAQVQREKEEARKKRAEASPEPEQAREPGADGPAGPDFMSLVSSLAAQALFALGMIPAEGSQQVTVDLGQARYLVEMLKVLRDKTEGNLTDDEQAHLDEALSELQQAYVVRVQQVQQAQMGQQGIDPNTLKA